MGNKCIVDFKLYAALPFENSDAAKEGFCACDLCAGYPGSELCSELGSCCINGEYHYWQEVDLPAAEKADKRLCGTCLLRSLCPDGSDPAAEACASYEPDPGLSGYCSALLLIFGFFGSIGCGIYALCMR